MKTNSELLDLARADVLRFAADRLRQVWSEMDQSERRTAFDSLSQMVEEMAHEIRMIPADLL